MEFVPHKTLILGIGNEFRQDDGVGIFVAKQLREMHLPLTDVKFLSGETTTILESWMEYDSVYVIDAVSSDQVPGTIVRINAKNDPIPKNLFKFSVHSMGISEAVAYGKILSALPGELIIYGISFKSIDFGKGLTKEVLISAKKIIKLIKEEIVSHPIQKKETFEHVVH